MSDHAHRGDFAGFLHALRHYLFVKLFAEKSHLGSFMFFKPLEDLIKDIYILVDLSEHIFFFRFALIIIYLLC